MLVLGDDGVLRDLEVCHGTALPVDEAHTEVAQTRSIDEHSAQHVAPTMERDAWRHGIVLNHSAIA
jgi:recombinational DNA repair protein (RecF pathway)